MNRTLLAATHFHRLAAWLRVGGADAPTFLQGQFTNDLRPLGSAGSVYGLWLDQKGRTTADSFVLPGPAPGEFRLASYFCRGPDLRRRLEAYVIADDVVIEDETEGWAAVTLIGDEAEAWARAEALPGVLFRGRRGLPACEWVFPAAKAGFARERLAGIPERSEAEMERARILARIPAIPRDVGPADLPNEGGLEEAAISYAKGCYLGQEIMARLKSRGNVRRRLILVEGGGAVPDLPAKLLQSGRTAGELRSAAPAEAGGFVGLAMIQVAGLRRDQPLSVESGGEVQIKSY